jgi:glycosyltransferase involved in cell wall biosynthesis
MSDTDSATHGLRVLAIVPAHNEGETTAEVVNDIHSLAPGVDVVVVDDCSNDRTGEYARRAGASVLPLPVNLGIGGAVQTGFKYAEAHNYDCVIQVDGDGQHDPAEIGLITGPLSRGEADVIIGSRFLKRTAYKAPFARRAGMILFASVARWAMRQHITDTTSGFRALNADAYRYFARHYPTDFPDAESLVLLKRAGFRLKEVSVNMRPRKRGHSSTTTLRSLYYPFKMILSVIVVMLREPPPRSSVLSVGETAAGPPVMDPRRAPGQFTIPAAESAKVEGGSR